MRRPSASLGLLAGLLVLSACVTPVGPDGTVASPDKVGAQSSGNLDPVAATNAVLDVYERVCASNATNDGARQGALRTLGFRQLPATGAAPFLRGGPGTIWQPAAPPFLAVPVAVVTRTSGIHCETLSPIADPATAAARFTTLIDAAARGAAAGITLRKVRDEPNAPDGGPGRFLQYHATVPSVPGAALAYALSARPPVPNGIALIATATPVRE